MKHYELKYEFNRLRFLGLNLDLSSGYFYNQKNREIIEFRVGKNKKAIEFFRDLVNYIGLPSRDEKFLKVFRLFELLGGKPLIPWRAIRVSIAHSSKDVTDPKLVNYLLTNFGELDISFTKRHQRKLFYEIFTELVEATYYEVLKGLKDPIILSKEKAQKIIEVLDSMRTQHRDETKHSTMYHYSDLEAKLEKFIPNRILNPYVTWK